MQTSGGCCVGINLETILIIRTREAVGVHSDFGRSPEGGYSNKFLC